MIGLHSSTIDSDSDPAFNSDSENVFKMNIRYHGKNPDSHSLNQDLDIPRKARTSDNMDIRKKSTFCID